MKGINEMASMMKVSQSAIVNLLRHNQREIVNNSNSSIDRSKSRENYQLMEREESPYQYYKTRKEELYCYNRKNVVTMVEWSVTVPKAVPPEYHRVFFEKTTEFLNQRYGCENCVSATVHVDETTPHLHYDFVPATQDLKHGGQKICCNDVMTREELRTFHRDLKRYLQDCGIPGSGGVMSGITQAQGGNRTVKEMKAERNREHKFSWNEYNQEHGRVRTEREW